MHGNFIFGDKERQKFKFFENYSLGRCQDIMQFTCSLTFPSKYYGGLLPG